MMLELLVAPLLLPSLALATLAMRQCSAGRCSDPMAYCDSYENRSRHYTTVTDTH